MSTYSEQYYWYLHACAELVPSHELSNDNLALLKTTINDFCQSNHIEPPEVRFSGFYAEPSNANNQRLNIIFPDQSCLQINAKNASVSQLNKGI